MKGRKIFPGCEEIYHHLLEMERRDIRPHDPVEHFEAIGEQQTTNSAPPFLILLYFNHWFSPALFVVLRATRNTNVRHLFRGGDKNYCWNPNASFRPMANGYNTFYTYPYQREAGWFDYTANICT